MSDIYSDREADWRKGALIYQVLVDRFAPSNNIDAKKHLYPEPKKLMDWQQVPKHGVYLESEKLWSHEIEFWGGDLNSVASKLDYLQALGVDIVYLNPIHDAYTNHKYDALDYKKVSPEFGERSDVAKLADAIHKQGMKLVLDGVFNHMGRNSNFFQLAQSNQKYQDWFVWDEQAEAGYIAWADALNLPELNLENKEVRDYVYLNSDSVVQGYLQNGVDGWRLDVAFDIGFDYLYELTQAAHTVREDALVVGEIWNYPAHWFPSIDGIMNFTFRGIIYHLLSGQLSVSAASKMLIRVVSDTDYEHLLMSWIVLDNHDTARLKTALSSTWQQRLAQLLQMTLPGSPNVYYGVEVGMEGGEDPEMRAPMRWDWVTEDNEHYTWFRQLIQLRRSHRALVVGDFRAVTCEHLLGFERYTDKVSETVLILVNSHSEDITETILVANSKLMNGAGFIDLLTGRDADLSIKAGLMTVHVEAHSARLLMPKREPPGRYTAYKRTP
ncbi:MAG: glycoside hydrolase family 13 protein [Alteromonadaceae bacterium]|nr:glycoside hydrolase family 13 protein [Alteromonadaceae bacterium]